MKLVLETRLIGKRVTGYTLHREGCARLASAKLVSEVTGKNYDKIYEGVVVQISSEETDLRGCQVCRPALPEPATHRLRPIVWTEEAKDQWVAAIGERQICHTYLDKDRTRSVDRPWTLFGNVGNVTISHSWFASFDEVKDYVNKLRDDFLAPWIEPVS